MHPLPPSPQTTAATGEAFAHVGLNQGHVVAATSQGTLHFWSLASSEGPLVSRHLGEPLRRILATPVQSPARGWLVLTGTQLLRLKLTTLEEELALNDSSSHLFMDVAANDLSVALLSSQDVAILSPVDFQLLHRIGNLLVRARRESASFPLTAALRQSFRYVAVDNMWAVLSGVNGITLLSLLTEKAVLHTDLHARKVRVFRRLLRAD